MFPGSRENCVGNTVVQRHSGEKGSSTTLALIWTFTVSPLASPTEPKQAQTMHDYFLLNMLQPPPLTPTSWDSFIDLSDSAHAPQSLILEPQGYLFEEVLWSGTRPGAYPQKSGPE